MNNARCKSIMFSLLLITSSISHIYAGDNDQVINETLPNVLPLYIPDNAQKPAAPSPDFTMPSPSEDDEKALQDALSKNLDSIAGDKSVQDLFNQVTNEMLEKYNEATIDQLQELDCILEEIATNIASNNLIPTRNRPAAHQKIKELHNNSDYLKTTNSVPLKADAIFSRAQQIKDLVDYARMNLEKGIDHCDLYDPSYFKPESLKNAEDVEEQLQKALIENNTAIEKLRAKATKIGLHYYNIAWRWMHRKVFNPWQKYYMTEASLGALWATTTAFFAWYYFGGNTIPGLPLPARFGPWLRNKVGWPAQSQDDFIINDPNSTMAANQYIAEELEKAAKNKAWSNTGLSTEDIQKILKNANKKVQDGPTETYKSALQRPVGWLGRFEHRLSQFFNNKFMVGTMVLGPITLSLSNVAPSFLTWLHKTSQKVDNFLLGGVYRYKSVDEFVLFSNTRFKDVIGNEAVKKAFRSRIEYFKNPEAWERMGIAPRTGILLYGPTRAGKSYIIDAFLGELIDTFGAGAGFKIWSISTSMILEKGIEWILDQASQFAPCIVVIEEIDLLGLQRAENKQLLSSFLSAMNSCLQNNSLNKQVIVVATTTNPDNIDSALLQIGRIGEHYKILYPSHDERKIYTERELNKLALRLEQFDIERLACLTEGCAYEQIKIMVQKALTAAKTEFIPVSQKSLEQNLENFVYGISSEPCKIDEKQKRRIATHLAGEILAVTLLDPNLMIAKATIRNVRPKIEEQLVYLQYLENGKQKISSLEYGKVFYCHDHDVLPINSKDDDIIQCKIHRAGHIAETLILGSSSSYHANDKQNDKQRAYEFALAAVGEGLDISKLPSAAQNKFFDEGYNIVAQSEAEVKALLEQHKKEIVAIADLLIEKETIGQEEINALIKKQN